MTKRYVDQSNKNSKKPKLDQDLEELWGDDLDEDALDDCFKLATQVSQQDKNKQKSDVTIMHSYSTFKQSTKPIFSSTQFEATQHINTSKALPGPSKYSKAVQENNGSSTVHQLEIIELRHKCEEKEGEALVLRNQLKEVKASIQVEQQKKQQEWSEKLNCTKKELNSLKTQLVFKNLELANLKQKILDLSKRNSMDVSMNYSQSVSQKGKQEVPRNVSPKKEIQFKQSAIQRQESYKVTTVSQSMYPLNCLLLPKFGLLETCKEENYLSKANQKNVLRSTNPYLQKQLTQVDTENLLYPKLKQNKNGSEVAIHFEYVYPVIGALLNCTMEDLHSSGIQYNINQVVILSQQILEILDDYLKTLLSNTQPEDIHALDCLYLSNCTKIILSHKLSDQIAVKASKCIFLLSVLVLCCDYLQEVLFLENPLEIDKSFNLPFKKSVKSSWFFSKLLSITTLIGQLRKAQSSANFLSSVVRFQSSICRTQYFNSVETIFSDLFKQILFSRPDPNVMHDIIDLFLYASPNTKFTESLCNKPIQTNLIVNLKKGTVLFNEDSCQFHVFVLLMKNSLLVVKDSARLEMCSKLLCVIESMLSSNHYWLYHDDKKRCECLDQFYKLSIEVIFNVLCKYKEWCKKKHRSTDKLKKFCRYSIRILSLLYFNAYDLTEKYITVYSQSKEILHTLIELKDSLDLSEDDVKELDKLNINEEVAKIPSNTIEF